MLVPDAGFVSTDLWDCQRPFAVAGGASGRDSGAKAAVQAKPNYIVISIIKEFVV